jgi:hypothetical protein
LALFLHKKKSDLGQAHMHACTPDKTDLIFSTREHAYWMGNKGEPRYACVAQAKNERGKAKQNVATLNRIFTVNIPFFMIVLLTSWISGCFMLYSVWRILLDVEKLNSSLRLQILYYGTGIKNVSLYKFSK